MKLITYDRLYLDSLIRKRKNEIKLGERVNVLPWNFTDDLYEFLKTHPCKYILLGLPEDIGVRANGGRGGTYSAWQPVLNTLLNTQSNCFLDGNELLILGHIDFTEEMKQAENFNFHSQEDLIKARSIVGEIDNAVYPIISTIAKAGKEAIIIGGGHNNAFPCMKGAAEGLHLSGKMKEKKINVINCDAHSDLRPLEGRHSGNAFSYGLAEGILNKYSIVGLHESYNTTVVMNEIHNRRDSIDYTTYEDIYIRERYTFNEAVDKAIKFIDCQYAGLEIDLDSVQNIPSSAKTSSGISAAEARKFIHVAASSLPVAYFHVAEAAPVLSHIKTDLKTGKLVSYFIYDYIKARNEYHQKNSE